MSSDLDTESVTSTESVDQSHDSASDDDDDRPAEVHAAAPAAAKKKKKKKKNKKKAESNGHAHPQLTSAEKAECDKRFSAAVKSLKVNDENDLWIRLAACNLQDSKARQLTEALNKNKYLTSLDLSDNRIGDAGAEAIVAALANGAVPELIYLDMRGNSMTEASTGSLANLRRTRKHLELETGPSVKEGVVQISPVDQPVNFDQAEAASESEVVRRYTQGGEQPMARNASLPPELEEDPQAAAVRLWQEVCDALLTDTVNITAMSGALRYICLGLTAELATIRQEAAHSFPVAVQAAANKPYYKASAQHVSELSSAIDHRGPALLTPYSRDEPQETGGGHLPSAAAVLAQLVMCGQSQVDDQIQYRQFVARLVSASLRYPCANPLQCATLQLVRVCAESSYPGLLDGLMSQQDGQPLYEHLASIGLQHAAEAVGHRPCQLSFIIQLSKLLREIQEGFLGDHEDLTCSLKGNERWMSFVGPHGVLQELLNQQQGTLVGPRPEKPPPPDPNAPDVLTGEQLLKLLQSMGGTATF